MVNYSGLSFWPFCCHVTHTEAVRKIAAQQSAGKQNGQATLNGGSNKGYALQCECILHFVA